jgi:hypothetical protein
MVEVAGIEIDLMSLIPALFGLALSIYNWLMMRKPEDIVPNKLISYAIVYSGAEEGHLLCFPLIFHNEGNANGMITNIKIGFKSGEKVEYIDVDSKVKLTEMSGTDAENISAEQFMANGYTISQPFYPIEVEAGGSTHAEIISFIGDDEKPIPFGIDTEFVIEVEFGDDEMNSVCAPFKIPKNIKGREQLAWFKAN